MEEIFLGVMGLQEAKNHQYRLKEMGVGIELKMNGKTCTTGCKITVELWGSAPDSDVLLNYFQKDFMKHVLGHEPNLEHLSAVFDPAASEVICQACGTSFGPTVNECPDCGLIY